MAKIKSKRLFLCLNPPLDAKINIIKIINDYKEKIPGARWTTKNNLHITLHFLQNQNQENEINIKNICHSLSGNFNPINFEIIEINAFPNQKKPRIIYLKNVQTNGDSAERLQKQLGIKLYKRGFNIEKRSWHPHVTIGRIKDPEPIVFEHALEKIKYEIKKFELTESILTPVGPIYKTIESYELQ